MPASPLILFLNKHARLLLLLTCVLSLVMHARIFSLDLMGYHVWRQTQTQTVIRNFAREDMNILHPKYNEYPETDRVVRMEFPLMQWLFALFYRVFGNHIVITRMLTFILGLCSVWGMYALARQLSDSRGVAFLAGWAFTFSPVFYYYTVNPLPDNFALCCGIWSLVFLFRQKVAEGRYHAVWASALFLLLATLAKLPFILYGAAPFALFALRAVQDRQARRRSLGALLIYGAMIVPAIAWYLFVIPGWDGNGIVKGITDNHTDFRTLLDYFTGNLISTLPELLLNYGAVLFFIAGMYLIVRGRATAKSYFVPLAATGVALIAYFFFELNMIATVHDYYLFPFLPLLFLIVAFGARRLFSTGIRSLRIVAVVACCILPVTAFLRADTRWDPEQPEFNPVYLRYRQQLQSIIPPDAYCIVGNDDSHFILLYNLDRKGWSFTNNDLSAARLDYCIGHGAKYLCSDAPSIYTDEVKARLTKKVFEADNVQVYELR